MVKVKCPNCGTEIELDKSSYNELLNDISGEEIDKRVKEQVKALEAKYQAELKLEQQKAQTNQTQQIQSLKQENEALKVKYESDLEIEKAKMQADIEKKLADLKEKNAALQEKLNNSDTETQLKVSEANNKSNETINQKDQEIAKLKADLKLAESNAEKAQQDLKDKYEFDLQAKDQEIEKWKNFRLGDSTKALGESLEQYCQDAFNEIRPYAFPRAYFEKDNDVDEEGKGDFIFRDYTEDGLEYISIMFEMKNQNDTTKTKHKNEHFFDKLDKNRTSKKCEYAVLVSTLEEDSKLYNSGIVDVSHRYPKMYVIRPQHFIAIIGLLKNMALNNVAYMQQVIAYQKENVDITNFENAVKAVADKINNDYENAGKQYDKVEKMCDDMIKKLQDLKETFRLGQKWLGAAVNQLPNLEVRKLTQNNPTMKEKFAELKNEDKSGE